MLSGAEALARIAEVATLGEARPEGKTVMPSAATTALREGASKDMGGTGKFLYNTGMSAVDSLVNSEVLLGLSAGLNTYNDVKTRGGTEKQAMVSGVFAGLAESFFEHQSLGKLRALGDLPVDGIKTLLKNLRNQAFVNFSEETFTELANVLFDTGFMGELSNYAFMAEQFMSEAGMSESEAKKKALGELGKQIGLAGASGALMGFGFGALGSAQGYMNNRALGISAQTGSRNYDVVQEALQFAEGSEARLRAEAIQQKLNTQGAESVSEAEYGSLMNAMAQDRANGKNPIVAQQATPAQATQPATVQEQVAEVQAANPDVKVAGTSVRSFMEAGDDAKTADRKSGIWDRVKSGDTTLTGTQLRKLDLQSKSTRAVIEAETGMQMPQTTDTKALLTFARSVVEKYAQVNAQQAAVHAQVAQAEQVAQEQAVQAEQRAAEIQKTSDTQAADIMQQVAAQAAEMAQQAESRKTTVADVFKPANQTEQKTEIRLSDGTTVTQEQFIARYMEANPGKSEADAQRMFADAQKYEALGQAYPAAVLQKADSAAQESAGKKKRRSVDTVKGKTENAAEGTREASKGTPTDAQRWTVEHLNNVLGKRKGAPKIVLDFDITDGSSGYYDADTNTVHINGRTKTTQHAITYTLGHELVHSVHDVAARHKLVDILLDFGKSIYGEGGMAKRTAETWGTYVTFYTEQKGMSRDEAESKLTNDDSGYFFKEELAANVMRDVLTHPDVMRKFAQEHPTPAQWLRDKANDLVSELIKRVANVDETTWDLVKQARHIADTLSEGLKKADTGDTMSAEKTTQEVRSSVEGREAEQGTGRDATEEQRLLSERRSGRGNGDAVGRVVSDGRAGQLYDTRAAGTGETVDFDSLKREAVTPEAGSELEKGVRLAATYGVKAYVVPHDKMRTDSRYRRGMALNGEAMVADDLTGKALDGVVTHEVTHTMRQNSFPPYVDFITKRVEQHTVSGDALTAYLNYLTGYCLPLWGEYENSTTTPIYDELDVDQQADVLDEFCSHMIQRHVMGGNISKLNGYIFKDGQTFIAELSDILEQYKAWNTNTDNKRFSVEAEDLIAELNSADKDDYSQPSYDQQARAWLLPEVVAIRNQKFTNTNALPHRKNLRKSITQKLMGNGSWDGTGYSGEVATGHHADVVIGLPGSGKSTVAANPLSQKNKARIVDSDMAKEMLPEYAEGKGAAMVHDESTKIRDSVLDQTTMNGENLVYVTVGSDSFALEALCNSLYNAGYTIALHYVDVTPKQAMARMLRRYILEDGTTGRFTPFDGITSARGSLRDVYDYISASGLVDYAEVIDNRGVSPVTETAGTVTKAAQGGSSILKQFGSLLKKSGATKKAADEMAGDWSSAPEAAPRKAVSKAKARELTPAQKKIAKIAKTAAFKNWFHDGNGELLDEKTGLPMVFSHGTAQAGYTRFLQQRDSDPGFWFAKHRHTADALYYTGRQVGDEDTREFIPLTPKTWEEAEDFLMDQMPLLELDYDRIGDEYRVIDAETGEILGAFKNSEVGLAELNNSYQDMLGKSYSVKEYWRTHRTTEPPNPGVYQVFLSMKNPLVVYCQGRAWNRLNAYMVDDRRVQKAVLETAKSRSFSKDYMPPARTRDYTEVAQRFGYDGVIFKDVMDGRSEFVTNDGAQLDLNGVYEILEKYNNFGAPDADLALGMIEDTGIIPSKMSAEDKLAIKDFLNAPIPEQSSRELPDDDFVVFDSSQIKSIHNEGTFNPENPDIRYSVDSTMPFKGQVNTALREDTEQNRHNALYIRETPNILAEVGLGDLPLCVSAKHLKDIVHDEEQGHPEWHGIPIGMAKRIPELLSKPVMILDSQVREGDIVVVTSETDRKHRPVIIAIRPNGEAWVDGKKGPANFVTSMYGREAFGNWLEWNLKEGRLLYWSKKRSDTLFNKARINIPGLQNGIAPDAAALNSQADRANQNPARLESSDAAERLLSLLTVSPSDEIIRQHHGYVKENIHQRRFSVDDPIKTGGNTGNVNPDTGYERGSVADSFMRIWNTGDRETALSVLEQTVQRLTEMEAERAEQRRADATTATFRPAGQLTEDAITRNKRIIEELIAKYGKMEQTSAAQQEVRLPKQRDDKTKTRGFVQTAAAAKVTPEAVLNEFERAVVDGSAAATYVPVGDQGTLRRAEEALEKEGFESLLLQWEGKFESGDAMTKDDIAKAEQLYVEACHNRDTVTAMKLAGQIAVAGTQAGQTVQAMTLLKKMTPSGKLYYLQKTVDRLNKDKTKKGGPITINEKLAKQLLEAQTAEEVQAALDAICQDLADQMPVTLKDKWNTWRYLAMLGNPRTHIRNLLGNAVFTPARLVKDMLGAGAERLFIRDKSQRTKAVAVSKDLRNFAKQDAEVMKPYLMGGGKYNPEDMIRDKRRIFRLGALNWLEQTNSSFLEAEDWGTRIPFTKDVRLPALRFAYVHALSGFLSARGADVNNLSGANSTVEGRKLLEEARKYATQEAKKATYRDDAKLARWLNHAKRNTGLFGEVLLEGVMPFTKTPLNIVKRGFEYSPLGIVKGLYDGVKGGKEAAEVIDEICAGFSGTMLAGLGAWLTHMGLLAAGHGDDDEDKFEELQGVQAYSLRLGDSSYTIDWMAPSALPLFVGSEIYSVLSAEAGEDVDVLDAVLDGLTSTFEPMLSLSMLDGLNSLLSANKYGEEDEALYSVLTSAVSSYFSQAVPTLFGQIARTADDSRRSTFVSKDAGKVESSLSRFFQTNVQGKIPVAAEGRMLYIDNWGRVDTEERLWMRALENFISPGYINEVKTTAVEDELSRLAEATNNTGVFPDRAKKYFSVDKENYAMSQEEYQAHLIERGQHSYKLVGDILSDPVYGAVDDKTRAMAVELAYDYASSMAKKRTNDAYAPDKWMLKLNELEQGGGDAAEYLLLRAQSKITGDSLTEVALGSEALTDEEVVNVVAMETSMPDKFTDPYTSGHEYVLDDSQQEKYAQFYRQYLAEEYAWLIDDLAYQDASVAGKYDMLKDVKSDVGERTRETMSDWLWEQGIEPTEK